MANFAQRKVARESIEGSNPNDIDGLSNVEPGHENLDTQLAEMVSEDAMLEQLEGDGETLTADIDRTESAVDAAGEAEANGEEMSEESIAHTEVAQESIRRRWGLDVPRVARESYRRGRGMTKAARESWKDTLKGLWERFLELVKSVINKIKDVKLKYINVGKSAQSRAKKYQAAIRNLGKKNKDEIGGSWITKLSIDGKFDPEQCAVIGKDVTTGKAKGAINALQKQAGQAEVVVTKAADGSEAVVTHGFYDPIELFGTAASKLQNLPEFEDGEAQRLQALPGNAYIQSGKKSLNGIDFAAVGFMSTGDQHEDKTVPTPEISKLNASASALDVIGKGFEKVLQDFRSYDSEIEKLVRAADKAAAALDKADDTEEARKSLGAARSVADQSVKNYQTLYRAVSYTANTVIAGLNGYIGAAIGAYAKR